MIYEMCEKFTDEKHKNNRLRLMATIHWFRWYASQALAFRAHNERPYSISKRNFLEMLEAI